MPDTRSTPLLSFIASRGAGQFAAFLTLTNFALYFARPQNTIAILGSLRISLILSVVATILWIFSWRDQITPQKKLLMGFLIFEGARGVLGKVFFDDLVLNDSLQFNTWADLFLQFCGMIFPLTTFFISGAALRSFVRVWLYVAAYLGAFVVMHGGRGPGGFIGDENDAGLVLLMLLPVPLSLAIEPGIRFGQRLLPLLATLSVLAGTFATFSRGTFVGLVCLLGYYFLLSRRKLLLICALVFSVAVLIPFMPQGYIEEMRTITDTSGGTAGDRRHFWTVATRVWLDKRHFIFGVGLRNSSYYLSEYEKPQDLVDAPSIGGRAVHSIYFQLLPDLGLWGILLIGSLVTISLVTNRRTRQLLERTRGILRAAPQALPSLNSVTSTTNRGVALEPLPTAEGSVVEVLDRHLQFVISLLAAMSAALIGIMSSGAFISALYYPPLWLITCVSGLLCLHAQLILRLLQSANPSASPTTKTSQNSDQPHAE